MDVKIIRKDIFIVNQSERSQKKKGPNKPINTSYRYK